MALTPQDVANKQFTSTRLGRGYDEAEVDDFLDEVEAELTRLLAENEDLRAQLAAVPGAGPRPAAEGRRPAGAQQGPPAARPAPAAASSSTPSAIPSTQGPTSATPSSATASSATPSSATPSSATASPTAPTTPAGPGAGAPPASDAPGSTPPERAAGILALAQRTADEHVAQAQAQAERIVSEARAGADSLRRDSEEQRRRDLGSLEVERTSLQQRIEQLRSFERDYRSRLRSYVESQLRALEGQADLGGPLPAPAGAASAGGGAGQRPVPPTGPAGGPQAADGPPRGSGKPTPR